MTDRVRAEADVRVLRADEVARIERTEPIGKGFVRSMWVFQSQGHGVLLVAWIGENPVGSGQVDRRSDPPELKNLSVHVERRGMGVGTAIIRAAEQLIGSGSVLDVGVGVDNPRARALYERLGYRATGELSTTTYEYVDETGGRYMATETDEQLRKRIP